MIMINPTSSMLSNDVDNVNIPKDIDNSIDCIITQMLVKSAISKFKANKTDGYAGSHSNH